MNYMKLNAGRLLMVAVLVAAAAFGLMDPQAAFAGAVLCEVDLQKTIEQLGEAFEQFKKSNNDALAEIKAKGYVNAELQAKIDKINDDMTRMSEVKSRLEALELKADRPDNPGSGKVDPADAAYKEAFIAYLRDPKNPSRMNDLQEKARHAPSIKAVATTSDAAGGYAVPEEISRSITQQLVLVSPIRQLAKVVTAGSKDYKELVDRNQDSGGWVGETTTRTETNTPQLGERAPTFGMVYAYPKATEESLMDIFFNVEQWLIDHAVKRFAQLEGTAFVSGNGSSRPTGFLNTNPTSYDDYDTTTSPYRTFGVPQYVPTGVAAGFGNTVTTSPTNFPGDCLITLVHKLKAGHRAKGQWAMNRGTTATIRKFKDAEGNYLWAPGLAAGQPNTLLGYPVVDCEDMPAIGSNAFPVAFGDWKDFYVIVDLMGMRVTRDEITTPGYVKFYVRKRVGGIILNDEAVKFIKCATT